MRVAERPAQARCDGSAASHLSLRERTRTMREWMAAETE